MRGRDHGLALLRLAPTATRAEVKQAKVCLLMAAAGAFFHLLFALYFLVREVPFYSAINVGSVLLYVVAVLLFRRGRIMAGVFILGLELFLYVNGMNVTLGFDAGFVWYYLTITVVAYMMFLGHQVLALRMWIGTFFLSGGIATFASFFRAAPDWVPQEVVTELYAINLGTNVIVLWVAAAYFAGASERAEAEAEAERQRSEKLLLNILPEPIAERLKTEPGVIADQFPSVTVLFSDIVGFTTLSAEISTEELIGMLNRIFSEFDRLAQKHGLEKIKTIGDAYMVVGGLPTPSEDHAVRTVRMGLDMCQAIKKLSEEAPRPIDVRIGIHTGPVVAGVIGVEKFAYDLWGDTVNTASRMESHGQAGRVQISQATHDAVDGTFDLEDRGLIPIKGKGDMRTWLVAEGQGA